MFKNNRNLLIIGLIALVNALGYGIIIPILYPYSLKFGLSDFQNGLLFATFSICQFISTPVIGLLSDKYGRRPLLVGSLIGTAGSFFLMAFAPNAWFLFLARALDGITAGNIPVAQAVISDTTEEKDRARGFGIIGASFGLGFIAGPAISALTVGKSMQLPFIIAGAVSVLAVVLTYFFLPETNQYMGKTQHKKLFDFKKLYHAVFDADTGATLLISLICSFAFSMFIYAYQPFALKVLHLNGSKVSLLFVLFGVIGLLSQIFVVARISKRFGIPRTFVSALLVLTSSFFLMFLAKNVTWFVVASVIMGFSNSIVQPLIQTILSEETSPSEQGEIMGINFYYMSIGQIVGPVAGGALATLGISYPFLAGSAMILLCTAIARRVFRHLHRPLKA